MKKIFLLAFSLLYLYGLKLDSNLTDYFQKENAFNQFGCKGENISPYLFWSEAPKNTKSFVITLYDIDAPNGWWHWIVANIPASVNALEENASMAKHLPKGAFELKNSYGTLGYGGPCPPKNDKAHRYIFTIYALDCIIKDKSRLFNTIATHTLSKDSLILLYKR